MMTLARIPTRWRWIAVALGAIVLLAAWRVSVDARARAHDGGRGIRFSHGIHADRLEMDCTDCHGFDGNRFGLSTTTLPTHEVCGVCHSIDETAQTQESCALCHTRPEFAVGTFSRRLNDEVRFQHDPHVAASVDCRECHKNPDKQRVAKGPLMATCVECHSTVDASMTECAVCHTEIRQDTMPLFRGAARILHDKPAVWERAHGHEYAIDPEFCATCHENHEESCEACHRQEKPRSHTVAWKRRTHGLHAGFNRQQCAVCHEEDSCMKCHENTQPASHRRGGWSGPADRHCVTCHFPEQDNNCTVCHESIEHSRAPRSVHNLGVFPANCARCHPAGNPFRAPHPQNSTARCVTCHR